MKTYAISAFAACKAEIEVRASTKEEAELKAKEYINSLVNCRPEIHISVSEGPTDMIVVEMIELEEAV